jgi:hypothetical protein
MLIPLVMITGEARASDPTLTHANGYYSYSTDYGVFAFSETVPLTYSITPAAAISVPILYSSVWLNASMPNDEHNNFPYVGAASILTATNTDFESSTNICGDSECSTVIGTLDVTWHFYSGLTPPKVSIVVTQNMDAWNPMHDWPPLKPLPPPPLPHDYGDYDLFWIHQVTQYTAWAVEGDCSGLQIQVQTPLVAIPQVNDVELVGVATHAITVDNPSNPTVCTKFDWTDFGNDASIYVGQFGSPMLTGNKIVVDFGTDVGSVDPTITIVISVTSTPSYGGGPAVIPVTTTTQAPQPPPPSNVPPPKSWWSWLPNLSLPSLSLPSFKLPSLSFPNLSLPSFSVSYSLSDWEIVIPILIAIIAVVGIVYWRREYC